MSLLIWIVGLVLCGLAISDIAKSDRDTMTKAVLIILVLLFPFVGPITYLLVFKDKSWS